MAYVANIVTVAEMQVMAGAGVAVAVNVEANHIIFQDYAEAYLSSLIKTELSSAKFTAMNATYKVLITEWAARFAGVAMIQYNMAGYTDGIEAENMIKIHWQRMLDIEALLVNASIQDALGV